MVLPPAPEPQIFLNVDTTPWLGNFDAMYANLVTFPNDGYVKSVTTWMTAPSTPDRLKLFEGATACCGILTPQYNIDTGETHAVLVAQTGTQGVNAGNNVFTFANKVRVYKNKQYYLALMGGGCNIAWFHDSTNNVGYNLYNIIKLNLLDAKFGTGGAGNTYCVWGDGKYVYGGGDTGFYAYSFNGITLSEVAWQLDFLPVLSVWANSKYIFAGTGNNGVVVYTFNGTTFTTIYSSDTANVEVDNIWSDGTYVYAGTLSNGIRAYTFDGMNLVLKDSRDDSGLAGYKGVCGDGTYIYTSVEMNGLRAYSFNGTSLTLKGSFNDGHIHDGLWSDGTYIYAGCDDGLRIYLFDGSNFTLSKTYTQPAIPRIIWGDGTYIYLPLVDKGIRVYYWDGHYITLMDSRNDVTGGAYYRSIWGDVQYIYAGCMSNDYVRVYTSIAHGIPPAGTTSIPSAITGKIIRYDTFVGSNKQPGYFSFVYDFEPTVASITLKTMALKK